MGFRVIVQYINTMCDDQISVIVYGLPQIFMICVGNIINCLTFLRYTADYC